MKYENAIRMLSVGVSAVLCVAASPPMEIGDGVNLNELGRRLAEHPSEPIVATTVCNPNLDSKQKMSYSSRVDSPEGCNVWIYKLKISGNTESYRVTKGPGSSWYPSWSPDGKNLAFYVAHKGQTKIWTWSIIDRELHEVRADIRVSSLDPVPIWLGSDKILVKVPRQDKDLIEKDSESQAQGVCAEVLARGQHKCPPHYSTAVSMKPEVNISNVLEGSWTTVNDEKKFGADLAVLNVKNGKVMRLGGAPLTASYALSPDGFYLAYWHIEPRDTYRTGYTPLHLRIIDVRNGKIIREISGIQSIDFSPGLAWSPDGRYIAYTSANFHKAKQRQRFTGFLQTKEGIEVDLFILPRNGEPVRALGSGLTLDSYSLPKPLWSPSSDSIYIADSKQLWATSIKTRQMRALTKGRRKPQSLVAYGEGQIATLSGNEVLATYRDEGTGRQGIVAVNRVTGVERVLHEADQEIGSALMDRSKRTIAFVAESATRPADLFALHLGEGAPNLTAITELNPHLKKYHFGGSRIIHYRDADGALLRATLLLPPDYKEGESRPTIVWVYAGTMGSKESNRFGLWGNRAFNLQMLATRGYVVLWPDMPVNLGTPMLDIMKATMPAIDAAIAAGYVDPERLGVMGQSNGGYTTLALLTQSRRFKAGVVNAGIVDLVSFHAMSGAPWLERSAGGIGEKPWDAPMRYVENSPMYRLDKIQAPILIQAGENDRPHVMQSELLFNELRYLGKEAIYVKYADEGHTMTIGDNLSDYWNRVTAFLDVHVKGNRNVTEFD